MISSTRVSVVRPALRVASMRTAVPRQRVARFSTSLPARVESTTASSQFNSSAFNSSAFAAGLAGGSLVLVGGIVVYQFSDVKGYVNAANKAQKYAKQTKDNITSAVANAKPADALGSLRSVVKSYSGFIPGADSYVDATFDDLQRIVDNHGDKATDIVTKAYNEARDVVSKGQLDADTATKLASVLSKRFRELQELGVKAGEDVLDAHPEVKEKLGGGYDQLKKLANEKGPEAKKAFEEVQSQVKDILKNGPTPENLDKIRKLLQEKTQQLRNTLEPAAREAWDGAVKTAKPYLDKVPEVGDLVNSNVAALAPNSKDVFDRVKRLAEAKGDEREKLLKEFKSYVADKANQASDSMPLSWDKFFDYVRSVPGGSMVLEKVPNAKALEQLSKERGEDAAKLAKETWDEVLEVLSKKADKAKKLAEGTKEDAKREAKK
ncbi:hypothetical protein BKA62DRAFT_707096 [Auriculariales sp. MPI-PUGE-AT-0066]|nr:hypothetical protein BKA62DRAFT_707096 [Auriculariales sp. MPI-PUGE-AT-0066]